MGVLAGGFIGQQVVPFAGRKHRDLRLASILQPVMVDDTFRNAAPAHQCAVVAKQHARPSLEIVEQAPGHFRVELEALEVVVFQLAVEAHRLLTQGQQPGLVCRHAHRARRVRVQHRVDVVPGLEQARVDDQATAAALRRVAGQDGVALEIVLDQRRGGHLAEHVLVALDQHVLRLTGHPQAEVVVGHVVDAVVGEDAVPGGELDPRLPFGGARLQARRRGNFGDSRDHVLSSCPVGRHGSRMRIAAGTGGWAASGGAREHRERVRAPTARSAASAPERHPART